MASFQCSTQPTSSIKRPDLTCFLRGEVALSAMKGKIGVKEEEGESCSFVTCVEYERNRGKIMGGIDPSLNLGLGPFKINRQVKIMTEGKTRFISSISWPHPFRACTPFHKKKKGEAQV